MQYVAVSEAARTFPSEFLFAADALKIVAKVLPVFVEVYLFIHEELMYAISKEKAERISIQAWQEDLQRTLSKAESKHFAKMLNNFFGK